MAGIRATEAGFERYEIAPSGDLDHFTCSVWTPKGELKTSLETADGARVLTVTAIDAKGTVVIPEQMGSSITVTGGDAAVDGNRVTFSQTGQYVITVQ